MGVGIYDGEKYNLTKAILKIGSFGIKNILIF